MPKKNKGGRPTKLTPALQEEICKCVRLGMKYERAALACGISRSTFNRWKKWGDERKSGVYVEFWDALKEAEAAGEKSLLLHIEAHGVQEKPGKWQALAWILERRHRDLYGPTKATEARPEEKDTGPARWADSPEEAGFELPDDKE